MLCVYACARRRVVPRSCPATRLRFAPRRSSTSLICRPLRFLPGAFRPAEPCAKPYSSMGQACRTGRMSPPRAVPGAVTGRPVTAPGCLTACLAPYHAQPDGRRRATRAASKLAARPRNAAHQLERGRPYPHGSPPVRGSRQRQCVERDRRRHKRAYARASALEAAFMADSQVPWGVEALERHDQRACLAEQAELVPRRDRRPDDPSAGAASDVWSGGFDRRRGRRRPCDLRLAARSRGRTHRAGRFRSGFSRALRTGFKCRMAFGGLESLRSGSRGWSADATKRVPSA